MNSHQVCEEEVNECYQSVCTNLTRPVYSKHCSAVEEEECEVVIEQDEQEVCTQVEVEQWVEQCGEEVEQQCTTVETMECQQQEEEEETPTQYGAPAAPTLHLDTDTAPAPAPGYGPGPGPVLFTTLRPARRPRGRKRQKLGRQGREEVGDEVELPFLEGEDEEVELDGDDWSQKAVERARRESAASYSTDGEKVGHSTDLYFTGVNTLR